VGQVLIEAARVRDKWFNDVLQEKFTEGVKVVWPSEVRVHIDVICKCRERDLDVLEEPSVAL
jgi:hypothetical protein